MHDRWISRPKRRGSPFEAPAGWWDPRTEDSFFGRVYRRGDNTLEGNLLEMPLTLEQRTARECRMIEVLAHPAAGSRILDCPCGLGRHSLRLAQAGFQVVGIDLDARAIEQASVCARAAGLTQRLAFAAADMRSFPRDYASFDLVINMFFSFGFFDTDRQNQIVLDRFARCLQRGGDLLIHTDVNPSRLAKNTYGDRTRRTVVGGGCLTVDETYDAMRGRLHGSWRLVDEDGSMAQKPYSVRIYPHDEFRAMCVRAGFSSVKVFGLRADSVVEPDDADEIVYLAHKG